MKAVICDGCGKTFEVSEKSYWCPAAKTIKPFNREENWETPTAYHTCNWRCLRRLANAMVKSGRGKE